MVKTRLYIARHGKTMFNTIGRAQGWSDTPLTAEGERGIQELGVGLKAAGLTFKEAFSSDSGRTLQTMEIILRECQQEDIPYTRDKRIREWCFGSLDGGYDGELFNGVLPRVFDKDMTKLSYEELAKGIYKVDTAGWAETWEELSSRILEGFTAIAAKFKMVAEIEKHHEERYRKLLKNIDDEVVFSKDEDAIWVCRNCGHIMVGKKAPKLCPVCAHPQSYFELRNENY